MLQLGQGGCPVDRAVIVGDYQGSPVFGGLVVGGAEVHWRLYERRGVVGLRGGAQPCCVALKDFVFDYRPLQVAPDDEDKDGCKPDEDGDQGPDEVLVLPDPQKRALPLATKHLKAETHSSRVS